MKSLHFLILSALMASNKPVVCHTTEKMPNQEQTQHISLQIKGLFHEFTKDWYIPNSHVILLTLVPDPKGGMLIEDIETKNHKLAKSLLENMYHKHLNINHTAPLKVKVNLTH